MRLDLVGDDLEVRPGRTGEVDDVPGRRLERARFEPEHLFHRLVLKGLEERERMINLELDYRSMSHDEQACMANND
jgi:hypothetical protein